MILSNNCTMTIFRKFSHYVQGQSPAPRIREYFYYIDHQGMLFLDDTKIKNFTSCFKAFFFKRLRINDTDRYKHFPYLSLCGRERNFVRCDDFPIVFTNVMKIENKLTRQKEDQFSYNHAHELLTVPFQPNKIIMSAQTGRVYHPAPERVGGVGLVKSSLAIEFSSLFEFDDGEDKCPTKFRWQDKDYKIDSDWYTEKNINESHLL
ncbi:UPF0598 protein CG30010 isoform X2 [Phymastichus coffea]|uniref:UPF0598 protein CG30010 isoform X2 n=1 Tax=Phymastichus coffea TaxID=108790 RepID=UPI00273B2F8D|nr:UPF0598 protein CG30010 isoform X2 [Phymastichus coffea]